MQRVSLFLPPLLISLFNLCYSAARSDFIKTLNNNAQIIRVRKSEIIARVDPVPTSKKTNATR